VEGPAFTLHHKPTPTEATTLPFVIPTGAYPDFLLSETNDAYVCGFPLEKAA
jgi:hypothetical protein